MPDKTKKRQVLELVRAIGILRPRDLDGLGISRMHLQRLQREGLVERLARGIYVSATAKPTEYQALAEACKRVPGGVICLLTALQFHGLTTQGPFEVWMALGGKAWHPKVDYPALKIVRFSGTALTYGIEEHAISGVNARIYSPAKTVADCFKYRNKIGLDVAMEALRDCWKKRKATSEEIWKAAKICRVANVIRPYMESLA